MKHSLSSVLQAFVLPGQRAVVFVPLACLATLAWMGKEFVNRPLETAITPGGLTAIALSGDSPTVTIILRSWTTANLIPQAFFALGLQFLWLLLVSVTLFFACAWSAQKLPAKRWRNAGYFMAGTQLGGGLYGAGGAVLIGFLLGGRVASPWPNLAQLCIVVEIVTFLVGALYAAAGLVVRELPRSSRLAVLLR
jgi:hypothetical protein